MCRVFSNLRSPFHFLATSCVGSSEQLNVSPRVGDQREAPISPTTTTVDAAGHGEGSGLTSCHTDPASQGQNPRAPGRQSATVCHFTLTLPQGATGERRTKRGSERVSKRSVWRKDGGHTAKEHPEAEGSFSWQVNNDLRLLKPDCCWLDACY